MPSKLARLALLVQTIPVPAGLSAQQDPARTDPRTLPTDSWTYEAIERLHRKGFLPEINPIAQPYRRIDVAAGLPRVEAEGHWDPTANWIRVLGEELAPELAQLKGMDEATTHVGAEIPLGGSASDSRRRDPLVPFRSTESETIEDRGWPFNAESAWLESHSAAIVADLYADHWGYSERGDPDGGSLHRVGRGPKLHLERGSRGGDGRTPTLVAGPAWHHPRLPQEHAVSVRA